MLDRVFVDALVQDADLVNPVHDAPDLRDCCPCESVFGVERLEPSLDFKWPYFARQLIPPAGNEVVPNVVLHDRDGVDRLWADCILAEVSLPERLRRFHKCRLT
jgi:hypothetical protein